MKLTNRAKLCALQMEQLRESVEAYEPFAGKWNNAGYDTPKNAQVNKTAIERQIRGLRQSLLALEKAVQDEAEH